ncbi:hypothetical protein ACFE04_001273 [Oxalis oulophora]
MESPIANEPSCSPSPQLSSEPHIDDNDRDNLFCPCSAGHIVQRTSRTAKNPNRIFYACPLKEISQSTSKASPNSDINVLAKENTRLKRQVMMAEVKEATAWKVADLLEDCVNDLCNLPLSD